jgi:hypothetical protein
LNYGLRDENLDRTNGQYEFAYEINVFAQDKEVSGAMKLGDNIVEELEELVINYFHSQGFRVRTPKVTNADITISRRMVRVSGIYDSLNDIIYRD